MRGFLVLRQRGKLFKCDDTVTRRGRSCPPRPLRRTAVRPRGNEVLPQTAHVVLVSSHCLYSQTPSFRFLAVCPSLLWSFSLRRTTTVLVFSRLFEKVRSLKGRPKFKRKDSAGEFREKAAGPKCRPRRKRGRTTVSLTTSG